MSHGHACWLVKLIPGFIDLVTCLWWWWWHGGTSWFIYLVLMTLAIYSYNLFVCLVFNPAVRCLL